MIRNQMILFVVLISGLTLGLTAPFLAQAAEPSRAKPAGAKVVYQGNQSIDFEGLSLEGELKTPGEFYFQSRNQERFDALTKRRMNFRREMMRDSVQSN